jgi:rhamnosyltransferase
MVVAGVVTFNPDLERLASNLAAISSSVSKILIVDNHSDNVESIRALADDFDTISLVANKDNLGISLALNQIASWASESSAEWVLLLDQDSVPDADMVDQLASEIHPSIAIVTPTIVDRNIGGDPRGESQDVNYCITSGSLLNISAWRDVGGYDPKLFIDFVDFDFCLRVREKGYRIHRRSTATLLHEIGHSQRHGPFIAYNHSAMRSLHLARDMVYYARKHSAASTDLKVNRRGLIGTYAVLIRRVAIVLLFESDRKNRSRALVRGAIEGSFRRLDSK